MTQRKGPPCVGGPFLEWLSGCVLLSHTVTSAVPSALKGLASGFGMEAGRFPFAMAAVTLWRYQVVVGLSRLYLGNCTVDA